VCANIQAQAIQLAAGEVDPDTTLLSAIRSTHGPTSIVVLQSPPENRLQYSSEETDQQHLQQTSESSGGLSEERE
jgi:hypothetical protein